MSQLLPSFAPVDAAGIAGSAGGALLFGYLTYREKQNRGRKLLRLERELSLGDLSIHQPANALGGGQRAVKLLSLREKRRVVALCGSPTVLLAALRQARVYRRRLAQSGVILVGVDWAGSGVDPAAGGDAAAAEWAAESRAAESEGWLWQPTELAQWKAFYSELLGARVQAASSGEGAWLALSLKGRSCGSGLGMPTWDELLGTKLPPLSTLSAQDGAPASGGGAQGGAEEAVLAAQARLYDALGAADHAAVAALCSPVDDAEVSKLAGAGRLDCWETVLKYDATVGIRIASQDATVFGDEAFTTGIEFPKAGAGGDGSGSLLCTQRWVDRNAAAPTEPPDWALASHRTIPYTMNLDAPACLRCDHRGCVALMREGLQGPAGMPGDGAA